LPVAAHAVDRSRTVRIKPLEPARIVELRQRAVALVLDRARQDVRDSRGLQPARGLFGRTRLEGAPHFGERLPEARLVQREEHAHVGVVRVEHAGAAVGELRQLEARQWIALEHRLARQLVSCEADRAGVGREGGGKHERPQRHERRFIEADRGGQE
jgi:hypothetical protein